MNSLLADYLRECGETQAAFAERAGVSLSAMGGWLSGVRGPDLKSAVLVEKATGGAVPVESWVRADGRRHKAQRPVRRVKRQPPKAVG
jgi:transcriptional regulator with XRE-family HTH domain